MKFLNNGVGYATVETSDGLEYLEFIGSTLTQLPYNFFDHFGQLIQVAKSFEKWNEEFSPDSDNGISEIRYVGVHQTEYVRDIIVYLKNEVPHLAVYRILKESYPHFELRRHKGPNSVSGYYTDDNGYDILGWSPDNHKLYFCSDRKDLDRELIGVRFSKEFLLY